MQYSLRFEGIAIYMYILTEVIVRTKSLFTLKKKGGERVQSDVYFMCNFWAADLICDFLSCVLLFH